MCNVNVNGFLRFVFVITAHDYFCVYDSGHSSKSSNMLNKTSCSLKQGASKQTQLQSSTLGFLNTKDKWHLSGGFSVHSANASRLMSFLSLSDIPLMLAA